MRTVEDLRSVCARLQLVEKWPTTLDGLDLVKRVHGVLLEGRKDTCRSYKGIAGRITMRHRRDGRVIRPSTSDVKWALKVLRARKVKSGKWAVDPGCPWEATTPPPLKRAAQPKQGTLELVDEWY